MGFQPCGEAMGESQPSLMCVLDAAKREKLSTIVLFNVAMRTKLALETSALEIWLTDNGCGHVAVVVAIDGESETAAPGREELAMAAVLLWTIWRDRSPAFRPSSNKEEYKT
ncbi:hypothetical protein PIB30_042134 [Stylosanthes scabra]|uniref:Uncharacterized protein n=1 Tax=Stylosanthes scabra TaxID=79078 RepID=A0ABU6XD87_9FABA|nr:hypothetical protein [Stylosanthes scabra]